MVDCYVGEIRMFGGNYAPQDWLLCDGSLLLISMYETLYSLIGTTYGGNGATNFQLPDLRGRIPIGQGTGTGLTPRVLGQSLGAETVALAIGEAPAHNHAVTAGGAATDSVPTNKFPGVLTGGLLYSTKSLDIPVVTMSAAAVGSAGQSFPHENIMPSLCITFIIATNGIYPTRD
jgi:microcystin-dependent protein